jgi:hypothetical protein
LPFRASYATIAFASPAWSLGRVLHPSTKVLSQDGVWICTPHALHCPIVVQVAQAGKHILGKPFNPSNNTYLPPFEIASAARSAEEGMWIRSSF